MLERSKVLQEVRGLDQEGRSSLRQKGVRFGAYHIYMPALLKPAPRTLAAQLWALSNGGLDQKGIDEIAHLASSGRTSIPVDTEVAKGLYRAAGYRVCGGRAVRVDILERLADLIRPAINYRPGVTPGEPPAGAADGDAFVPTVAMTSLVGCAGEDFASILKSLGYASERRAGPAITVPILPAASTQPVTPKPAETATAEAAPAEAPPGESAQEAAASAPAGATDDATVAETAGEEPAPADEAQEPQEPQAAAPVETATEETAPAETAAPVEAAADETPVGETTPAQAPESAEGETDAPIAEAAAEPEMIDVWRQSRHQREGGRERHRHGRGGRPENRGARADGERPRGDRPRQDRPGQDQPRQDRPRQDRPGQGQERSAQERPRDDRGGRDKRREDRPQRADGAPRPDNRPPRGPRRDDGRPQRFDDRPREPRREKQPDPNSPFAKLAALKAQLEEKR